MKASRGHQEQSLYTLHQDLDGSADDPDLEEREERPGPAARSLSGGFEAPAQHAWGVVGCGGATKGGYLSRRRPSHHDAVAAVDDYT